jgi:hypothetical protein
MRGGVAEVIINLSFHRLDIKQEILEWGEESPRGGGGGGLSREQARAHKIIKRKNGK